ncbi:MAG: general secretion pathway protein GspK [Deltaproteobacteria bacterium]|nr:general secretion pathway protein GspK [Deltaproteobacteria bacterium]
MPASMIRTAPGKVNRGQQGFALVVVIVIMLMISFLAAQLILSVRTELRVALNDKAHAAGVCLAQGGVNLGLFRLLDKPVEYINEDYEIFIEGHEYDAFLETGHLSYYVVNESGKLDLNKANMPLLKLFLEYMQTGAEEREVITDSLQDWIDTDDLHRLNGAELDTYQDLEDPYIPRNGEIMDPAEFFLVNGTEHLAGLFKANEVFTVHNSTGMINFNSLTPLMLDFLTEGDEEKKKAYREAKDLYGNLSQEQAMQILGNERFDQCSAGLTYTSGNNKFYSIVARGEAGVDADILAARETGNGAETAAIEVRVLFELRGNKVNYFSWEEDWS